MKSKILILGKNSFVGKSIIPLLQNQGYEVISYSHKEYNPANLDELRIMFHLIGDVDFVINCCLSGEGRLLKDDIAQNFYENLIIQENLLYLSCFYKKLIVFSSGAQENRNNDIVNLGEGEFGPPSDNYYSLAKYINSKRVIGNNKVINIRIFNVFGPLEKENKFIKLCINKCLKQESIEIWGDTHSDFFYIEDLFILINHYINNPPKVYEEINAVYDKKETLFWIADMIKHIGKKTCTHVIPNGINKFYTGNGKKLKELNLPLIGLWNGISETYKILKEEYEWENSYNN